MWSADVVPLDPLLHCRSCIGEVIESTIPPLAERPNSTQIAS
jgi:hypothetical protein